MTKKTVCLRGQYTKRIGWTGTLHRGVDRRPVSVDQYSEKVYRVQIGRVDTTKTDELLTRASVSDKLNRFLSGVGGWTLTMPSDFYERFEGLLEQYAEHIKVWHNQ